MSQKTTIKFEISYKRLIAIIILLMLSAFLLFLRPLLYGRSILLRTAGPAVNIDNVRNRIQELKKKEKEYTSKMYPSGSKLMKMKRDQLDGALRDKVYVSKVEDVRYNIHSLERSIKDELKRQEYEKQKLKAYFCVVIGIVLELFWVIGVIMITCYLIKQYRLKQSLLQKQDTTNN